MMRASRTCQSLRRLLRLRFGFRTFLLSLAAIYFTAMYIMNSGLSRPRQARDEPDPVHQWDAGGADDTGHERGDLHPNRRPVVDRDRNLQAAFDSIRRVEQRKREGGDVDVLVRPPADYLVQGERTDNANRPTSCNTTSTAEQQRRNSADFLQVSADTYLLSAFWDQRPNDFDNRHNGTLIRIMAILRGSTRPTLECDFGSDRTSTISVYEMCENHHRAYGSFILSCQVPDNVLDPPCFVKVTAVEVASVDVPVRTLRPTTPPSYAFSVCVPPLFGDIAPAKLVEFFELTFIFGADHMVVYDFNTSPTTRAVVQHYTSRCRGGRRCRVELLDWKLPDAVANGIWYNGQSLAIQDCLYRQMSSSRYVVFSDIDEYIVPRRADLSNWAQLAQSLQQQSSCAFQFVSAFFDPAATSAVASSSAPPQSPVDVGDRRRRHDLDLLTMRTLRRTQSFSNIRTKCMVQPYRIFEAGIHHISKPIWAHLSVDRVDDSVALLHHYRSCLGSYGMNCFGTIEDKTIHRYYDDLLRATGTIWNEMVDIV